MNVPFPFRVAAGVMAVGLDRLRTLPADIPALSVSLAGHAVRASMRFQQEIAHLAARGEEVLAPLTDRPEENPSWAHFDDDDDYMVDGAVDGAVADGGIADGAVDGGLVDGTVDGDLVDGTVADDGMVDGAVDGGPVGRAVDGGHGPMELPEYDGLRVSQLRARLDDMDKSAVARLLGYEKVGRARAAYLTALQNRLTTLESENGRRTQHRTAP